MRVTDKFKYCEIQTECIEIDSNRYEDIGVDFRSLPVDSRVDRICCRCGESLSADGKCDYCEGENERM